MSRTIRTVGRQKTTARLKKADKAKRIARKTARSGR